MPEASVPNPLWKRYKELDPLTELWRAQAENTVGGWCVTLAAIPGTPADGNPPVADFVTETIAEHVVALHNQSLPFEKLIEASSLGTPAAKALRARTTEDEVAKVRAVAAAERVRLFKQTISFWLFNELDLPDCDDPDRIAGLIYDDLVSKGLAPVEGTWKPTTPGM